MDTCSLKKKKRRRNWNNVEGINDKGRRLSAPSLSTKRKKKEGINLRFRSPVCFSNLKQLELIYAWLPEEHSTQELFSGCTMLEDLKLENCNLGSVEAAVSVVSPRLRSFTMIEDQELWFEMFKGPEFVIFGGALKYFCYEGEFLFDFNILDSYQLEEVCINFYSHTNDPITVKDHFLTLLRYTSNVPKRTLKDTSCLLGIPEVWIHIPMFNGVQRLELDYVSPDLSNTGLLKMLQNMSALNP